LIKNNKKQLLNTTYNKIFRFRFYPDSEQKLMLEYYFGYTRFVYNKTLDYSIKHYVSRENKINDDYGNLIIIKKRKF
jgi:transposase